ncbi:ROK family protein [Hutsoniella sourekii]|uniref:ROK family protein n=1 Tax=Hutsoniella sourekii TaxID=87650 RepID=UPI000486EAD1|nr:ROK family protein [Hutsoniella sourekii]
MIFGAIEAGGTKFNCAVSDENFNIIDQVQFPTVQPEETMESVYDFFDRYSLDAMGIGSFGPIDVLEDSATYGYVTTTPKPGWANFDFLGSIKKRYDIPVYWTTDVNASGFGEYHQGAAVDKDSCLYLTIGTGVGGGFINRGEIQIGMGHLEMGHVVVRKHPEDDYQGHCPYHGDCLEGLVCGPAIADRFPAGVKGQDLDADDPIWNQAAYYIAQALRNYSLTLMPEQIIIGGGVMHQEKMMDLVKKHFQEEWADYLPLPDLDEFIVRPGLGDEAGIVGCLLLAQEALKN